MYLPWLVGIILMVASWGLLFKAKEDGLAWMVWALGIFLMLTNRTGWWS